MVDFDLDLGLSIREREKERKRERCKFNEISSPRIRRGRDEIKFSGHKLREQN